MPFQIADSVQLRNEGPCMVVTKVLQNGKIACCWFDGRELQEEEYFSECLTSCEEIDANTRMLQAILYLNVNTI
ncbi:MAG: YodC family protein [Aeromonas veronii]